MPESPIQPPAPRAGISLFGVFISFVWILILTIYCWQNKTQFGELKPNELGDFAAGAFAPLAFLWLVLGFFQQGDELRNSGRALWLQGEELRNSVEQQRNLVNATREQLDFERETIKIQRDEIYRSSQPILQLKSHGDSHNDTNTRQYRFVLFNYGRACTNVTVRRDNFAVMSESRLDSGNSFSFSLILPFLGEVDTVISISYTDERLMGQSMAFRISGVNGSFQIFDNVLGNVLT